MPSVQSQTSILRVIFSNKKTRTNLSAPFVISSGQSPYATRLRRNSKADTPIANNAIDVGSGTTPIPAFHGVVAGKLGVEPDTKAPSETSVLQAVKSLLH